MHSTPDVIEVAGLDGASLDFISAQLNKADKIRERLQAADFRIGICGFAASLIIANVSSTVAAGEKKLVPGVVCEIYRQQADDVP